MVTLSDSMSFVVLVVMGNKTADRGQIQSACFKYAVHVVVLVDVDMVAWFVYP